MNGISTSNPAAVAASSTAVFPANTIVSAKLTSCLEAISFKIPNVLANLSGSLPSQLF